MFQTLTSKMCTCFLKVDKVYLYINGAQGPQFHYSQKTKETQQMTKKS